MMLSYFISENGIINIENVDSLKEKYGRYSKYMLMSLSQAKREHRKNMDLQGVHIEWIKL